MVSALDSFVSKQTVYVPTAIGTHVPNLLPNVIASPCFRRNDRLLFHYKQGKVLRDIERRINISVYDITHAHFLFSGGYVAHKLYQKHGIQYIVAVQNTDVNAFLRHMLHLRPIGRKILRDASKIIFFSDTYRETVLKEYVPERLRKEIDEKSIVIPIGIDPYWLQNKFGGRKKPEGQELRLIYVGNTDRNKNLETTVDACRILTEKGYNVRLTVIGKLLHPRYEVLIANTPFITHIPFCGQEEIIGHLRKSDVFVMPSKTETFGLVYAEAMSQGLPLIYTRGQGFDSQFPEGEVGYAVPWNDPEEIVRCVLLIYDDFDNRSRNCVDLVDRFSWQDIAAQYASIYANIAGDHLT
jgi:glycosyltransferase involved in cell wall biosynthesis